MECKWQVTQVACDFNDSDFQICENVIVVLLNEYAEIPWDALKYLIAEANYGCSVTDDWDRRVLRSYINGFFQESAIQTREYPLSTLPGYYIPDVVDLQGFKEYVASIPSTDKPELFGQHPNADIASQIRETGIILETLQSLQPQIVLTGTMSREDKVLKISFELARKVPDDIDYEATCVVFKGDSNPLNLILLREIKRYNSLLLAIRSSLDDLDKSIKGLISTTPELDALFVAIFEGKVPYLWSTTYSSLKPLASWMRDLNLRVEHFNDWSKGY